MKAEAKDQQTQHIVLSTRLPGCHFGMLLPYLQNLICNAKGYQELAWASTLQILWETLCICSSNSRPYALSQEASEQQQWLHHTIKPWWLGLLVCQFSNVYRKAYPPLGRRRREKLWRGLEAPCWVMLARRNSQIQRSSLADAMEVCFKQAPINCVWEVAAAIVFPSSRFAKPSVKLQI